MREQFGRIVIPPAVAGELARLIHPAGVVALRATHAEEWLLVEAVMDAPLMALLRRDLDPGEAEGIALASVTGADWPLIDEAEGRAAATRLGLRVTGVLGILLRARRTGRLSSLREKIR